MVENRAARRAEHDEHLPHLESPEEQVDNAYEQPDEQTVEDTRSDLEKRAAALNADSIVQRMDKDGKPEKWHVLEAHENTVVLGRGARREVISREEAVLEVRASEYGPSLATYWDSVVATTEVIPDAKQKVKANKLLEDHKIEIMRMAALTVANDDPADLEAALHHAMQDVMEDRADRSIAEKLGRAIDANEGLLSLRTGPRAEVTDEVPMNLGADVPDAYESATDKTVVARKAEVTLPVAMAKAAKAGIDLPPQALAPARGEITTYAVLEAALAFDTQQMDSADIEAHLAYLTDLQEQLSSDRGSQAYEFAVLDIQNRRQALLAQQATSEKSLGVVRQMLQEIQAQKPTDRKRGRPVDVGNLMLKLNLANIALRGLAFGSPEWSMKTQENWALEKRILEVTGRTEELHPENYSQLYAYYKEAMRGGEMTKEDAIAALEDLSKYSNTLTGKDAEGLRILFEELTTISPVGESLDDDLDVIDTEVGSSLDDELEVAGETLVDRPAPPTPPFLSKNAGKHRPIPLNALRKNNNQYGRRAPTVVEVEDDETSEPMVTTGAAVLSAEPSLTFGAYDKEKDERKGPSLVRTTREAPTPVEVTEDEEKEDENLVDFLENRGEPVLKEGKNEGTPFLERDNTRILRPELTPRSHARDYTEEGWMAEGDSDDFEAAYTPDAEAMKKANPDALYANVSVETAGADNEPFRKVADVFGGAKEFRRMYTQLEKEGRAPFNLEELIKAKKFGKLSRRDYINAFSEAAGIPVDEKEKASTPFEQVAEAFSGEENFVKIYKELEDADLAPLFTLDELRASTRPAKEVIAAINEGIKELEKRNGGDTLMRAPTPYEEIVEAFGGQETFESLYKDFKKTPYTLDELKNMKRPSFWRRFIPDADPVAKTIRDIRKALQKKRGGLQS